MTGLPIDNCCTALWFAVRNNNTEVAQFLIEKEADVDNANYHGFSPVLLACKLVVDLISKVVQLLLQRTDLERQALDGKTALHMAATENQAAIAEMILNMNANVESRDKDGWKPLHWAAQRGHGDVARVLLQQHGANPEAKG